MLMHNMNSSFIIKKLKMNLALDELPLDGILKENQSIDTLLMDIIATESIPTFSNFFPYLVNKFISFDITNRVDRSRTRPPYEYYIFDETDNYLGDEILIIGIRDMIVDNECGYNVRGGEIFGGMMGLMQGIANSGIGSLLNSGDLTNLYEFRPPNKIKINSDFSNILSRSTPQNTRGMEFRLMCTHPLNLTTIPHTKSDFFYNLVESDVKRILYEKLKRWKTINTVYVEIDLGIDEWEDSNKDKRKEIEDAMRENQIRDGDAPKIIAF